MSELENVNCPQCLSFDVEAHNRDELRDITVYWCANCGLHFTNFDYCLNRSFKYKMSAIENKEFSQPSLIELSLTGMENDGIEQFMNIYNAKIFIYSGKSFMEVIFNLSFVETTFHHLRNINEKGASNYTEECR